MVYILILFLRVGSEIKLFFFSLGSMHILLSWANSSAACNLSILLHAAFLVLELPVACFFSLYIIYYHYLENSAACHRSSKSSAVVLLALGWISYLVCCSPPVLISDILWKVDNSDDSTSVDDSISVVLTRNDTGESLFD